VLFLGASETPGALSDEFISIDDHWKIYRKRRDVQLLSQIRLPLHRQTARRPALVDVPRTHAPDPLILQTYDQLLDRFMPPGFLVDEDGLLIDSFAGAERFLKVRRRRPSSNLLDLLDDDLRAAVSGAIQRAVKERAAGSCSSTTRPIRARGCACCSSPATTSWSTSRTARRRSTSSCASGPTSRSSTSACRR